MGSSAKGQAASSGPDKSFSATKGAASKVPETQLDKGGANQKPPASAPPSSTRSTKSTGCAKSGIIIKKPTKVSPFVELPEAKATTSTTARSTGGNVAVSVPTSSTKANVKHRSDARIAASVPSSTTRGATRIKAPSVAPTPIARRKGSKDHDGGEDMRGRDAQLEEEQEDEEKEEKEEEVEGDQVIEKSGRAQPVRNTTKGKGKAVAMPSISTTSSRATRSQQVPPGSTTSKGKATAATRTLRKQDEREDEEDQSKTNGKAIKADKGMSKEKPITSIKGSSKAARVEDAEDQEEEKELVATTSSRPTVPDRLPTKKPSARVPAASDDVDDGEKDSLPPLNLKRAIPGSAMSKRYATPELQQSQDFPSAHPTTIRSTKTCKLVFNGT